jgi:hypothetical protein
LGIVIKKLTTAEELLALILALFLLISRCRLHRRCFLLLLRRFARLLPLPGAILGQNALPDGGRLVAHNGRRLALAAGLAVIGHAEGRPFAAGAWTSFLNVCDKKQVSQVKIVNANIGNLILVRILCLTFRNVFLNLMPTSWRSNRSMTGYATVYTIGLRPRPTTAAASEEAKRGHIVGAECRQNSPGPLGSLGEKIIKIQMMKMATNLKNVRNATEATGKVKINYYAGGPLYCRKAKNSILINSIINFRLMPWHSLFCFILLQRFIPMPFHPPGYTMCRTIGQHCWVHSAAAGWTGAATTLPVFQWVIALSDPIAAWRRRRQQGRHWILLLLLLLLILIGREETAIPLVQLRCELEQRTFGREDASDDEVGVG